MSHIAALAKESRLDDISIVQVARDFGVAPGLIHYYVGSRDKLISAVLNRYYEERVKRLPPLCGDWRADVATIARVSYAVAIENPGVAIYVASHNRFRLFQDVEKGETDYGVVFFNHVSEAFLQGGFTPEQVSTAYHLLAQYLVGASRAEAGRQMPAFHREFILKKIDSYPDGEYPAAKTVADSFASLNSEATFEAGLKLLLDGYARWVE